MEAFWTHKEKVFCVQRAIFLYSPSISSPFLSNVFSFSRGQHVKEIIVNTRWNWIILPTYQEMGGKRYPIMKLARCCTFENGFRYLIFAVWAEMHLRNWSQMNQMACKAGNELHNNGVSFKCHWCVCSLCYKAFEFGIWKGSWVRTVDRGLTQFSAKVLHPTINILVTVRLLRYFPNDFKNR